jgi:hypothetical protein
MPEGPVFVNGLEATVGGAGELLGQVADSVGQAAELLKGLKGLLDAIAGIFGSLLIDAGFGWLIGGGVAFWVVAEGPVVAFDGFAPGFDAVVDVLLVAAVLLVAGEMDGGLEAVVEQVVTG